MESSFEPIAKKRTRSTIDNSTLMDRAEGLRLTNAILLMSAFHPMRSLGFPARQSQMERRAMLVALRRPEKSAVFLHDRAAKR